MSNSASEMSDLQLVAKRIFWWKTPSEALADKIRFLAQVMTLGTWNDIQATKKYFSEKDFKAVLQNPPPGVFDPRSWSYWHRLLGWTSIPPLPQRKLPE